MVLADDMSVPVPTFPPNMNGIAFAHASGQPFSTTAAPNAPLGYYAWSRDAFGVDWSPLVTQLTRNGLTLTWASFNLPTSLQATTASGTYASQFLYGPDHQRYRQTATYSNGTEITSPAGGVLEKVTGSQMAGMTS